MRSLGNVILALAGCGGTQPCPSPHLRDVITEVRGALVEHAPLATALPPLVRLTSDEDVILLGQVPRVYVQTSSGGLQYRDTDQFTLFDPDGKPVPQSCDATRKPTASRGYAVLNFECQPLARSGVYTVSVDPTKVGEPPGPAATMRIRVVDATPPVAPAPPGWNAIAWNQNTGETLCLPRALYSVATDRNADVQIEKMDLRAPRKPPVIPQALVGRISADHARGIRYSFELADGYLVLFNHGEWGGGLEFFPHAGGRPRDIVIGDPSDEDFIPQNVQRAEVVGDYVYVLQGLGHMGLSTGQLSKVWREHGHFTSHTIARFDSAPIEWLREPAGAWLVLTREAFWRVTEQGQVTLVASLPTDAIFYVTSAIRARDGSFYLGTQGGVVRLTPTWPDLPRYAANFLLNNSDPLPKCPDRD